MTAVIIGHNYNTIEIPLVFFASIEDAHKHLEDLGLKRDFASEEDARKHLEGLGLKEETFKKTELDWADILSEMTRGYSKTEDGQDLSDALTAEPSGKLVQGLFSSYGYDGSNGAISQVEVREIQVGVPMVGWQLDLD